MRKILSLLTVLLTVAGMVSCTNGQNRSTATIAENVNVEEFAEHLKDAQLLDVRTPDEWSEGIIKGAAMANVYDADFETQLAKLDKEKPVAVYCKSGGRSGQAMAKMKKLGFKEVYNLNGGITAWQRSDRPIVAP